MLQKIKINWFHEIIALSFEQSWASFEEAILMTPTVTIRSKTTHFQKNFLFADVYIDLK